VCLERPGVAPDCNCGGLDRLQGVEVVERGNKDVDVTAGAKNVD
jgi:hypothetical protein